MNSLARLLIRCPDQPGIIAAVTNFLHQHGANVTDLDQHAEEGQNSTFWMRLELQTPKLDLQGSALKQAFQGEIADRFAMDWKLSYAADRPRTVIFVSRYDHALLELLWRLKRGDIAADLAMVISNHTDLANAVEDFGVPFHHVPVTKQNKAEAEAQILDLISGQDDLLVLARYMQILSGDFVARYPNRIINIHHSFLPAFAGADPYAQAMERGVKIIGATAHYVTEELDAGPIIEQSVSHVSHRHSLRELKQLGRDIERRVLAQAVQWHVEDRILVDGNKTIVFS
ncbi:MAG: formyltetrahydrofolate deformylase [Myxococcales bacterium]|nr:formyltetrahydrofolate deformylase [Myxococcales bacterium]